MRILQHLGYAIIWTVMVLNGAVWIDMAEQAIEKGGYAAAAFCALQLMTSMAVGTLLDPPGAKND